jgi:hypothetical protein
VAGAATVLAAAYYYGYESIQGSALDFHFPVEMVRATLSPKTPVFGFIILFATYTIIGMSGLNLIAQKKVAGPLFFWSVIAIWVFSLIGFGSTMPGLIQDFKAEGNYLKEDNIQIDAQTVILRLNQTDTEYLDFKKASIQLQGHEYPYFKIVQNQYARGRTKEKAVKNAMQARYDIQISDSSVTFQPFFNLNAKSPYRFQKIETTFYIPFNQPFQIEEEVFDILKNTTYPFVLESQKDKHMVWKFTEEGLECLNCLQPEGPVEILPGKHLSGNKKTYPVQDFNKVTIGENFNLTIKKGISYEVIAQGKDLDDVLVSNKGGTLEISLKNKQKKFFNWEKKKPIVLTIQMPELSEAHIHGVCQADIKNFNEKKLLLSLSGAAKLKASLNVDNLETNISGASSLKLIGKGKEMNATLSGVGLLNAENYQTEKLKINASGASQALIKENEQFEAHTSGAAIIKFAEKPKNLFKTSKVNI